MSFFDDVMKMMKDSDDRIKHLGDDLGKDLKDSTAALETEISTLRNKLQSDLNSMVTDFGSFVDQARSQLSDHQDDIKAIASVLPDVLKSQSDAIATITKNAAGRNNTEDGWTSLMAINKAIQDAVGNSINTIDQWETIVYSAVAEAGVVVEVDGDFGLAGKTDKSDYRVIADVMTGAGVNLNADMGASVGYFQSSPKDMKGAIMAVRLDVEVGLGVGVVGIFKMTFDPPAPVLDGIAFGVTAGLGEEADAALGYTFTWK